MWCLSFQLIKGVNPPSLETAVLQTFPFYLSFTGNPNRHVANRMPQIKLILQLLKLKLASFARSMGMLKVKSAAI